MNILQIVPAQDGWFSTYRHDDGSLTKLHVAVWAIVDDGEETKITGFSETDETGFLHADNEACNFDGWVYEGRETP
jgi:hypothetical protein